MQTDVIQIIEVLGIGLVAGTLGGLAGVGGSMIILPGLHLVLGEERASTHHMYMAAAMAVNFAVSLPATIKHKRNGLVRTDLLPTLLVSTAIMMLIGVFCSNQLNGHMLRYVLAAFLIAYCVYNLMRIFKKYVGDPPEERVDTPRLVFSGGSTGFVGGLLGLGGGVLQVPMLQFLCRIRLKQAIATSAAVICVTAVIGATAKILTLKGEGERWQDALLLAGLLAPTAIVGGMIGATLTHRLPVKTVRVVITLLLMVAAARLLGWGR